MECAKELHSKTFITQIAPTLSQMLKIPFPNGTGAEILEKKRYLINRTNFIS
jgi:hypothetical protein